MGWLKQEPGPLSGPHCVRFAWDEQPARNTGMHPPSPVAA